MLRDILNAANDDALRYADEFPDPDKLLAAIESMGLEGMVSKLVEQPYRLRKKSRLGQGQVSSLARRQPLPFGALRICEVAPFRILWSKPFWS